MRLAVIGTVALAAAALAGCGAMDPRDGLARAEIGTVVGAMIGAGIGATVAINPVLGAQFGAAGGAAVGTLAGYMMSEPPIRYGRVPARDTEFAPSFYDTWPPGYATRPAGLGTPPPPARPG